MTARLIDSVPRFGCVASAKRKRPHLSKSLEVLLSALLVLGVAGSGRAQNKMVANVPDFYQHQFWEALPAGGLAGWEASGGWCLPTAITDALYPWKVQAKYGGLFDDKITQAGKWLPASGTAVRAVNAFGWDINGYLNSVNLGPAAAASGKSLTSMRFDVNPATGVVTVDLAGGKTEVVNKAGANYTPFGLYQSLQDQGRTSVLVLNQTAASSGNGLWWGNFHAVAGAGYNAAKQQILFADPDSNKANLASNAGWWNLNAAGDWDKTAAGKAAAIARVQANMYDAKDAAASPPLPGNLNGKGVAYTNSDLYGTIAVNGKGLVTASDDVQKGVAGVYDTGRYVNTTIASMDMISPTLAANTGFKVNAGKYESTFSFAGDVDSKVDKIELFPTVALADTDFGLPSGSGWKPSVATSDPYGYSRPGEGLELTVSDPSYDLSSGMMISGVTLDTSAPISSFDVYYHDSLTDQWIVQSLGAIPPGLSPFQLQAVPEPTSFLMLALGLGIAGSAVWIRRRGTGLPRHARAARGTLPGWAESGRFVPAGHPL